MDSMYEQRTAIYEIMCGFVGQPNTQLTRNIIKTKIIDYMYPSRRSLDFDLVTSTDGNTISIQPHDQFTERFFNGEMYGQDRTI